MRAAPIAPRLDEDQPINRGLVGFWPLTEGGGQTVLDLSPWRNDGRGVNSPTWNVGRYGKAAAFSGPNGASSQNYNVGARAILGELQLPMTITAWIYPTSSSGFQPIVAQYGQFTAGQLIKMLRTDTGTLKYYCTSNSGTFQAVGTLVPSLNVWSFVSVSLWGSLSSPSIRIRLNASTESPSLVALRSSITSTITTRIGSHENSMFHSGNEGFNGRLQNIRIWNRTLTQGEENRLRSDPWIGTRRRPPRVWYLPSAGAYTLTAEHGTINLTGQAVALTAARKMVPEHGALALTGQDVSLPVARKMVPEHGAIALTGQDVGLTHGYNLIAEHGEIILTGQDVDLTSTGSEPEVATPTGGDDAPARRADVERLGRLRRRQEREQEDRQRKLRESIEAAYAAAQGLPAKPSREDRAPLREAVAEAAAVATPEVARDVARLEQMAATLRTARHVKRLIQELQALRARLRKEDDAMTVLLMVM